MSVVGSVVPRFPYDPFRPTGRTPGCVEDSSWYHFIISSLEASVYIAGQQLICSPKCAYRERRVHSSNPEIQYSGASSRICAVKIDHTGTSTSNQPEPELPVGIGWRLVVNTLSNFGRRLGYLPLTVTSSKVISGVRWFNERMERPMPRLLTPSYL